MSKTFNIVKLAPVFNYKTVVILENKEALPRAFFVSKWEIATSDEILRRLVDIEFPLREKIILEESFGQFEQSTKGSSNVRFLNYESQRSKLAVSSDTDGFLFLADTWYPGWKALVDGKEEKIFRANYTFRAVPVTSGQHVVEFIYDPRSFRIGKWLSLATFIFLIGLSVYEQAGKKRKRIARKRTS
ncbi:YfhO family protein [Patescibacteria group bacterium]|nr:YfhO family protein [Patescibacteria group bacterium]